MAKESEEKQLREQQIESWGKLLAGVSHDLKNHLGIIRESGGLIDDMVEIQGKSLDPTLTDRLQKMTATIEKRVEMAAEMLHHLSSFAHRADSPESNVLLGDILQEETAFLHHFARMKQVELHIEKKEEVALVTSPTLLHHLIYRIFLFTLEQLQPGEKLTITVGTKRKNSGQIFFYREKTAFSKKLSAEKEPYNCALQIINGKILTNSTQIILEINSKPVNKIV